MTVAEQLANLLKDRGEKIVFAESCTCGLAAALMGEVPGVSEVFCGSSVVYRPKTKIDWLNIDQEVLKKYTAESPEMADDLAAQSLYFTKEANWSIGIVGHLYSISVNGVTSVNSIVHICVWHALPRRSPRLKSTLTQTLDGETRQQRQQQAATKALEFAVATIKMEPRQ